VDGYQVPTGLGGGQRLCGERRDVVGAEGGREFHLGESGFAVPERWAERWAERQSPFDALAGTQHEQPSNGSAKHSTPRH